MSSNHISTHNAKVLRIEPDPFNRWTRLQIIDQDNNTLELTLHHAYDRLGNRIPLTRVEDIVKPYDEDAAQHRQDIARDRQED
jgi:hypothetical protein